MMSGTVIPPFLSFLISATLRGLFRWAHKAGMVKTDPTLGVENLPRKKGAGFIAWTEDHMAAYERRWPIGTRQRVWLDVLAYTGLRRGDVVRLGRQHVRGGVATIKTEKSGYMLEVLCRSCRCCSRLLMPDHAAT